MTSETISETIPASSSSLLPEPPSKSLAVGSESGSVNEKSSSDSEDTSGDSDTTSSESDYFHYYWPLKVS